MDQHVSCKMVQTDPIPSSRLEVALRETQLNPIIEFVNRSYRNRGQRRSLPADLEDALLSILTASESIEFNFKQCLRLPPANSIASFPVLSPMEALFLPLGNTTISSAPPPPTNTGNRTSEALNVYRIPPLEPCMLCSLVNLIHTTNMAYAWNAFYKWLNVPISVCYPTPFE